MPQRIPYRFMARDGGFSPQERDALNLLVDAVNRLHFTFAPPIIGRDEAGGVAIGYQAPAATKQASSSLEVTDSTGTPDYTGVTKLVTDHATITLTQPAAGQAEIAATLLEVADSTGTPDLTGIKKLVTDHATITLTQPGSGQAKIAAVVPSLTTNGVNNAGIGQVSVPNTTILDFNQDSNLSVSQVNAGVAEVTNTPAFSGLLTIGSHYVTPTRGLYLVTGRCRFQNAGLTQEYGTLTLNPSGVIGYTGLLAASGAHGNIGSAEISYTFTDSVGGTTLSMSTFFSGANGGPFASTPLDGWEVVRLGHD